MIPGTKTSKDTQPKSQRRGDQRKGGKGKRGGGVLLKKEEESSYAGSATCWHLEQCRSYGGAEMNESVNG